LTLHAGHQVEALNLANRAREADPRLPESGLKHVESMLEEGKREHAIAALSEWNPDPAVTVESQTAQADAHMKKMRWGQAEQLYREALEIQPRYADLRLKHGQALLELGELTDAANEFREALTLNAQLAEAHALLGVTLRRQGDEGGSKACFKAAVDIDPNHPIASAELMRLRG
ncbi:MAG: tetratricopeptide repeat protein, partial [Armatimonadota bacterium]